MDAPEGQAKVPARVSIQVSEDLKRKLDHLDREEYGGNLQVLIRETPQVRVDRVSDTNLIRDVLKDVREIDRKTNCRHEELLSRILQLLDYGRQLEESAGVQHTDITALSGNWLEVKRALDNQAQLIARVAARVERQNDTLTMLAGHIERRNEAMDQLLQRSGNETRGKSGSFLAL